MLNRDPENLFINLFRPRGIMDNTSGFGPGVVGSNPTEGEFYFSPHSSTGRADAS